MTSQPTVLLVGGTGRTGGRVLAQLLERGVAVRAIVRSATRLPQGVASDPLLTVVEADLLSLSGEELQRHLEGCDTVISCLGHTISVRGILGPPYSLVTRAVTNLARAIAAMRPAKPVRLILMSTVSVNQPANADTRRGSGERLFLGLLCVLMPPARDNQRAADFLVGQIGEDSPAVEWVAVRPDTLLDGEVTEYRLHDELVSSIFKPDGTNMANVAHFMCELTTDDVAWQRWKAKMPVIVNAGAQGGEG
ncbi:MAG: NAD(P)H-binding protein [Coriobacteriia bacterium]|nr:NAD(P)H-binding protein [Coriobacteriia bacterium]